MSQTIVDIIGGIVQKTSERLLPYLQTIDSNITAVHYYYGHWVDITEQLLAKDAVVTLRAERYPAICLQQDLHEEVNPRIGIYCNCAPRIIIAMPTRVDAISYQRYQETFKPVLLPIYDAFIKELKYSGAFMMKNGNIEHSKTDRLYWGRNGDIGNVVNNFNEYLDCIDLSLKLSVYDGNCK